MQNNTFYHLGARCQGNLWDTLRYGLLLAISVYWNIVANQRLCESIWRGQSCTASVAITRVRRVRELHVVVIFDLAFWSANPPGRRCDMDGSQRGLGATYWVLSLPKLMQSSSLFLQEVWFFQVFPMFLSTCFLYLFCIMFRSGSAWSVAKQDGDAACSTTQRSWNLGTLWDDLGRLRKIRRTV